MSIGSLNDNMIALDDYFKVAYSNFNAASINNIQSKLCEIIKQILPTNRQLAKNIRQLYLDAHVEQLPTYEFYGRNLLKPEAKAKLQQLAEEISFTISMEIPDFNISNGMIEQQQLENAIIKVKTTGNLADLEALLKQGLEVNMPIHTKGSTESCLSLLLDDYKREFDKEVIEALKLLLKHGAKINEQNFKNISSFIAKRNNLNDEVIELFILNGLDLNARGSDQLTIMEKIIKNPHHKDDLIRSLIFYGAIISAYRPLGHSFFSKPVDGLTDEYLKVVDEWNAIREDAAHQICHVPSGTKVEYDALSFDQKKAIAKRCEEIDRIRKDRRGEQLSLCNTEIDQNKKFEDLCLHNNFDEASKLLKEGNIDLNAPLVNEDPLAKESQSIPLIVYACRKGNIKLVEFLLKAGADPNNFYYSKSGQRLPPIIEAALIDHPDKKKIMKLLADAGADPNKPDIRGNAIILSEKAQESLKKTDFIETILHLIEFGLNPFIRNDVKDLCSIYSGSPDLKIKFLAFIGWNEQDVWNRIERSHFPPYIEIRNAVLKEIAIKYIADVPGISKMSMDLVNMIYQYNPVDTKNLTPAQRIELYNLCMKKI